MERDCNLTQELLPHISLLIVMNYSVYCGGVLPLRSVYLNALYYFLKAEPMKTWCTYAKKITCIRKDEHLKHI